uniref:Uncharacterized protein n=1 Tax=Tetranychus urticae TaxID=32264 RepID=T1K4P2_TETUR
MDSLKDSNLNTNFTLFQDSVKSYSFGIFGIPNEMILRLN